jgi:hypothetical protein
MCISDRVTVHGWSPCFSKRREERERKKEKFYIYSDGTHTHMTHDLVLKDNYIYIYIRVVIPFRSA